MWMFTVAAAATPPSPAETWFRYSLAEDVRGTSGAYVGYVGGVRSNGRYDLHADRVSARYEWTFSDSEGKRDHGSEDRLVAFDPATRRYRDGMDLDDPGLAALPPSDVAVWFWIDPAAPDGPIRVLDTDCTLSAASGSPNRPGSPTRRAECPTSGHRVDDYGVMDFTGTQTYWYDAATGVVVETEYRETDRGTIDGAGGGFERVERFVVVDAGFLPSIPVPSWAAPVAGAGLAAGASAGLAAGGCSSLLFGSVLAALGIVGAGWWVARNQRPADRVQLADHGEVHVRRLADALDLAGLDPSPCTKHFGACLEDLAARAVAAGDPVFVAVAGARIVGFAWQDRAAGVGTVLTPHTELAQNFVRRGIGPDFFSESRHLASNGKPRFNVHEGWTVLELLLPSEVSYDPVAVRRYQPADRAGVVNLLNAAWGQDLGKWLDLQLQRGDLAFVAQVDGKVVGFALAAVTGTSARLTLNTVDPAHRDRGLGTELVRARLAALARLGVEKVGVEVADWNVAMAHVLQSQGFVKIGSLVLQTTRAEQVRHPRVRR